MTTTDQPQPLSNPPAIEKSGLALASMILGIVSMVLCLGPFAGIPAVVCGHIALSRVSKSGGAVRGGGQAIAGLIMGYIGIIMLPFLGILAGMTLPAIAAARERARRAHCMNNLSQIGKSFILHSMDHDGKFPDDLQAVAGQMANPRVFVCKSSGHEPGGLAAVMTWTDYAVLKSEAPKDGLMVDNRVVAYCRPENHKGKGSNVLFADGSVRWLNGPEFAQLMKSLNAPVELAPPSSSRTREGVGEGLR